jgi:hypothetical protein
MQISVIIQSSSKTAYNYYRLVFSEGLKTNDPIKLYVLLEGPVCQNNFY